MAKARLLLVEDDVTMVKMYQKKFLAEGYEVVTAYDGEEGLKKVKEVKPDLVILDVMMPKLDGLAVFKLMKAEPATKDIPVILLTNFDQKDAIYESFTLEAVEYLIKSDVTPAQVVQKVEELLKKKK